MAFTDSNNTHCLPFGSSLCLYLYLCVNLHVFLVHLSYAIATALGASLTKYLEHIEEIRRSKSLCMIVYECMHVHACVCLYTCTVNILDLDYYSPMHRLSLQKRWDIQTFESHHICPAGKLLHFVHIHKCTCAFYIISVIVIPCIVFAMKSLFQCTCIYL